jgi:hypothetical protein
MKIVQQQIITWPLLLLCGVSIIKTEVRNQVLIHLFLKAKIAILISQSS